MLLCGWALAAYIAVSASMTRSSTDCPGSATRRPMLVPQVMRRSPISRLSPRALRILLATRRALTRLDFGSITANSSPPRRATVSVSRTACCSRREITRRTSSPALWPNVSLMPLKESRSRTSSAGGSLAPGRLRKGVAQDRVERRPVGKLGQRVGQRHPFELDLGFAQHRRSAFDAFLEFLVDGLQVIGHQVDPGNDRGDVVPGTGVRESGSSGHRRRFGRCLRRGHAAWGPADQYSLV